MNYYNENDPNAAAWLRQLIADRLIPAGDVDERSITEIKPHELTKYTQCHFFAGIGGWSLALELAGWPADEPVWTGSCPCQPFSSAGKRGGTDDERHLWPAFFALIEACGPWIVFGEQVASSDVVGKVSGKPRKPGQTVWFDGVCADLEGSGYTTGAAVLGAHSAGADHQRQRLYWVAHSEGVGRTRAASASESAGGALAELGGSVGPVAVSAGFGLSGERRRGKSQKFGASERGQTLSVVDTDVDRREEGECLAEAARYGASTQPAGFWADSCPVHCSDGKWRRVPVEPALFPLASRLPYAVGERGSLCPALLKGSGNSIVPQTAAMFVRAFREVIV